MKKAAVLIALALVIAVGDIALTYNSVILNNDCFDKNDFELTKEKHSEAVWDKVFFGNGAVSNAYIEDWSEKGYINLGLRGVDMTDLERMLDTRHVKIGTELVIGLDYKLFCGGEGTEYIWDKKLYEPYLYFERERLIPVIKEFIEKKGTAAKKPQQEKSIKRGAAHDRDIADSIAEYESLSTNQLEENIRALESVIGYCKENEINLRAIWMPWNVMYDKPDVLNEIRARVDAVLSSHGIGVYDMENIFSIGDFYDVSCLNYDVGSPKFTALIEEWF